jgi:FSR family fosmidomycin resistance protein-like MFS transporter
MSQTRAIGEARASDTVFPVLAALAFCHLLNDMMQSLVPALYPGLKEVYALTFAQVGTVTFAYQATASLLQPLVGMLADRKPVAFSLPAGTLFTIGGLLVMAHAPSYGVLLAGAALLGFGSAIFHPESSRIAHMAAGGRRGLAQSLFHVGGNIGSALGPVAAAAVVARGGQARIGAFSVLMVVSTVTLSAVGVWHERSGLARLRAVAARNTGRSPLPRRRVIGAVAVLLGLIFSKYIYMASFTSYYTFYLIRRFGVSVPVAQIHLFAFMASIVVGTLAGGALGDRFGRRNVIWLSILGALPFALVLPYANLAWTGVLSVLIGATMASAFPAIVVYGQELMPEKLGMVSGLFFGFSFGVAGLGAALLGGLADAVGVELVYRIVALMPALGLLTAALPDLARSRRAGT